MPYGITCMWNLKCDTNELTYETDTDSQTQRTDMWLPRGRAVGEGWIGRLGLADVNYYVQEDKQQGPTVYPEELYSISCDKP